MELGDLLLLLDPKIWVPFSAILAIICLVTFPFVEPPTKPKRSTVKPAVNKTILEKSGNYAGRKTKEFTTSFVKGLFNK